jgi:hypothetical protein
LQLLSLECGLLQTWAHEVIDSFTPVSPYQGDRELEFTDKKFDGRVLHVVVVVVVVVVIGVNVASDVQSVMADHFGRHPYCVTHNWFLKFM